MIRVQRTVTLEPPPDAVFAYLTDVERIPEWQSQAGIKRVVRTSEGPMGMGSTFRMERVAQGRSAAIRATISGWNPPGGFAFETIDDAKFAGTFDTRLDPLGSGTRLTWTVAMQPPGLWRLLSPVIRRAIEKAADTDFATLQRELASTEPSAQG
jgi:carbon monoxide dehydrogenase subunit G